jgi:ATP-dependent Lon protease
MILLPGVSFYFKREDNRHWNTEQIRQGEEVLFLLLRTPKDRADITAEDCYPIGLAAEFVGEDEEGMIQMRVTNRIDVADIENKDGVLAATGTVRADVDCLPEDEKKSRFETLRTEYMQFIQNFQWGIWIKNIVQHWTSMEDMICSTSGYLSLTWEERYQLMALDSEKERYTRMEEIIHCFFAETSVVDEAQEAQKQNNEQMYREAALKRQIDYMQRQLTQLHPENRSDEQRFEEKIAASGMNDTAMREAQKVLGRMKQEGQDGHEYGLLYDYLDFVTSLSWKKEEPSLIDLKKVEKILDEDHYGLKKVKERIVQQMAVMALNKKQSGSILLFVGAPGTGKTSIGQSIARALGRSYVRISLGGIRDEAEIRGHRRTYVGAMPGRIMEGIKRSGTSNPVVVLDEVDKLAREFNGDPASALLEVLDPEQNSTFTDHYMNVPYDLSDVLFVCTANTTDTIPEPLLNRMEVIQFPGYSALEKKQIARRHLLPHVMKECGIPEGSLKISDKAFTKIIEEYTMESGVRSLKRQLEAICRKAAVLMVRGEKKNVSVNAKGLKDFLGNPNIHHEHRMDQPVPGVATGLAWTSAGGEILFIESRLVRGSGSCTVTGQLGDVMKESVQIAVSLVKSLYPEEARQLKDHDLHIHVPAGAVPKDGPSAGITLVTALASLLTGKTVDTSLGMTGEISLRGRVMPIGGLPEKLMAAQRAGLRRILIPEENMADLEEVPAEVRDKLEIKPVGTIEEVLRCALA